MRTKYTHTDPRYPGLLSSCIQSQGVSQRPPIALRSTCLLYSESDPVYYRNKRGEADVNMDRSSML